MKPELKSVPTLRKAIEQRMERHELKHVTVFLTNGVALKGKIVEYDSDGIWLMRDGITQDVFYHAIATIMPDGQ